jgi:hypothetical protein
MNGLNNRKAALKLVWASAEGPSEEKKNNVVAFNHYFAVIHGGKAGKKSWHRNQATTLDVA